MQVLCSLCGGDTDTAYRCLKCGHSMQPLTGCTQPAAPNNGVDAIAQMVDLCERLGKWRVMHCLNDVDLGRMLSEAGEFAREYKAQQHHA